MIKSHIMLATKSFLKKQSLDALRICGGKRKNMCDVVVNELSYTLNDDFNYNSYSPMYAPVNGRKHFVCLLPAHEAKFTSDDGYIIIDPTIKQFENKNQSFPDVAIINPHSTKYNWYDSVEIPE